MTNLGLTIEKKVFDLNEIVNLKVQIGFFQKAQYLISIGKKTAFFYIAKGIFFLFTSLNI